MCVDAAEYSLNVISASVGPVIRQSILERYDGNKNYFFTKCKFQLDCGPIPNVKYP